MIFSPNSVHPYFDVQNTDELIETLSQMREGKAKTIDTPLRLDKHKV